MALFNRGRRARSLSSGGELERPFWARPSYVISAAFVFIVAVLGIWLAVTSGGDGETDPAPPAGAGDTVTGPTATAGLPDDTDPTSAPPDTSGPTSAPPPPPAAEGDCPALPGTDGNDVLSTGPQVEWLPIGEVSGAVSPEDGPTVTSGIKACYAHTPTGALLAGYNFLADARTSSLDTRTVFQERVTGPNLDDLLADAEAATPNTDPITVVGYRFVDAAADRYTISLAQRMPGTSGTIYFLDRVTVEWTGGDWYVTDAPDLEQIDSPPPDYVLWGPEAPAGSE